MEPLQTCGTTSPQQGCTQPAQGCSSGPQPVNLMLGEHEGTNPQAGRVVTNETVDCTAVGTSGVSANMQEGHTRLHIYECFSKESKKRCKTGSPEDLPYSELTNIVIGEMGNHLKPLSASDKDRLIDKISYFLTKTRKMFFRDCKSNKKYFQKKHKVYLEKSFLDDIPEDLKLNVIDDSADINETNLVSCETIVTGALSDNSSNILSNVIDEPASTSGSCHYESLSYRQQQRSRRRLAECFHNEPPNKIIKTFVTTMSTLDKKITPLAAKEFETVIQHCLQSPTRSLKVMKKINAEPQPYTPEEALGVMIDRKFSVETYKDRQQDLKTRGYPVYPPYAQVLNARK